MSSLKHLIVKPFDISQLIKSFFYGPKLLYKVSETIKTSCNGLEMQWKWFKMKNK